MAAQRLSVVLCFVASALIPPTKVSLSVLYATPSPEPAVCECRWLWIPDRVKRVSTVSKNDHLVDAEKSGISFKSGPRTRAGEWRVVGGLLVTGAGAGAGVGSCSWSERAAVTN